MNLSALRTRLEEAGKTPHSSLVGMSAAAAGVPEVEGRLDRLAVSNEKAVGKLATCLTGTDGTLTACAYQAAWAASRFPEMDVDAARLEQLVVDAAGAVPPPPTGPGTTTDPRFLSPVGPR